MRLLSGLLVCLTLPGQDAWQARLTAALPVTSEDFAKADRGDAVGRLIRSPDSKTIGILGMIRLPVSKEQYWEWYRNPANLKKSDMVAAVAEVHTPPRLEDFSAFQFTPSELRSLRKCQPHSCGIKASGAEIGSFRQGIKWSTAEEARSAADLGRRWLSETVRAYRQSGDAALPVYEDKAGSVRVSQAYRELTQSSAGLLDMFPGLRQRLDSAAPETAAGEELYFWTIERYGFGLQPVLNVMHAFRLRPAPEVNVICSKQLRATHYYEASLSISILLDRNGGGTTLIYVNRSRIDALDGLGGWKRKMAELFAPRTIRKQLDIIRKSVAEWASSRAGTTRPPPR